MTASEMSSQLLRLSAKDLHKVQIVTILNTSEGTFEVPHQRNYWKLMAAGIRNDSFLWGCDHYAVAHTSVIVPLLSIWVV